DVIGPAIGTLLWGANDTFTYSAPAAFYGAVTWMYRLTALSDWATVSMLVVDPPKIDIWDGQNGAKVTDKVNVGAFTVANYNDTNGDWIVDSSQDVVKAVKGSGRDEVDLMKIVIHKPEKAKETDDVVLKVRGDAAVWMRSWKEIRAPQGDGPGE